MQDQIRFISNPKKIQILKRFVDEEYVGADQSMKEKMKTEIEASKVKYLIELHNVYPIKICLNSEKGLDYFYSKKQ